MGPQGSADRMLVPVMMGPVDDERPAGQLEAEGEEEKRSPAVAHLVNVSQVFFWSSDTHPHVVT